MQMMARRAPGRAWRPYGPLSASQTSSRSAAVRGRSTRVIGQPGPEGHQDDRLLGLEAEDVRHRGEQLVRGLNDEIHRSEPPQLAWAACGARSMRADTYLSETPTSPKRLSTTTTSLVRFSPVSLSGQLSVRSRPWTKIGSPDPQLSCTWVAAEPKILTLWAVGSSLTHSPWSFWIRRLTRTRQVTNGLLLAGVVQLRCLGQVAGEGDGGGHGFLLGDCETLIGSRSHLGVIQARQRSHRPKSFPPLDEPGWRRSGRSPRARRSAPTGSRVPDRGAGKHARTQVPTQLPASSSPATGQAGAAAVGC